MAWGGNFSSLNNPQGKGCCVWGQGPPRPSVKYCYMAVIVKNPLFVWNPFCHWLHHPLPFFLALPPSLLSPSSLLRRTSVFFLISLPLPNRHRQGKEHPMTSLTPLILTGVHLTLRLYCLDCSLYSDLTTPVFWTPRCTGVTVYDLCTIANKDLYSWKL